MIDKQKQKLNMKVQWTKFAIVLTLYLLFLCWVESWLGLIVVPFIYDVYITKKIRWQWWKDSEGPVRFIMSWVDALVFALVAVYFINLFFFQNYVIPSSSLEKSLLTGDYLFVSKMSYGPRIPQTPLTMPLTQHTMPLVNVKSYIEWPHWDYRRVKGLGKIQLNDIVVFNFPAGDSLVNEERIRPVTTTTTSSTPSESRYSSRMDSHRTSTSSHPCSAIAISKRYMPQGVVIFRTCQMNMATSSVVPPTDARTT